MVDHILIIDGELPSGLSAVRSLAKAGLKVDVLPTRKYSFAANSKYVNKKFRLINPINKKEKFKNFILKRANKYSSIFCFTDDSLDALNEIRNRLPKRIRESLPPKKSIEIVLDKLKTYQICKKFNIPSPRIYQDVKKINKFPVVVKSRSYKNKIKTCFIKSQKELHKFKDLLDKNLIFQEYINGREYGAFFLANRGKILISFAHLRDLSFESFGGASVVRHTIKMPNIMYKYSKKIISYLKWNGVIMIEYKKSFKNFKLLEINGRYWGSLPLIISSGINLPYLHYLMNIKMRIKKIKSYKKTIQKNIIGMIECFHKHFLKKSFFKYIFYLFLPIKDDVIEFDDLKPFVERIKFHLRRA